MTGTAPTTGTAGTTRTTGTAGTTRTNVARWARWARWARSWIPLLGAVFALAGCGDNDPAPGGPLGRCGQVTRVAEEPALHVTPGQAIGWSSNPPATGRHYPAWAGWNRSYSLLARGYWLHNAEHGGVVLLHNCPDGCAADVEALLALVREQPRDGQCSGSVRNRILVVADPDLPPQTRFAAVAWGAYYAATCLDPEALGSFIASHYARGPEDLCGDGLALGGAPI